MSYFALNRKSAVTNPNAPKPKAKEWEAVEHIGFGATFGFWHMFSARNKKTGAPGTMFVVEKKLAEKHLFGKANAESKQFFEFLKRETQVPRAATADVAAVYDGVSEEGGNLVFTTEPLVGTLASLYFVFGHQSLSKVRRQAEVEAQAGGGQKLYANSEFNHLLQYCSPDMVAYGFTTLLRALINMHSQEVIFGNITPANIGITPRGEWRLVGCACCQQNGVQFEYNTDSGALTRPCAHYMSPKMLTTKHTERITDMFQLASTIYSVFGDRPCKYSVTAPYKMFLSTEELVREAEKMYGCSPASSTFAIAPNAAMANAQTVPKYYQILSGSSLRDLTCLSLMEPVMPGLFACANEQGSAQQLYNDFVSRSPIAKVAAEMYDLRTAGCFAGATPQNSQVGSPLMNRTQALLTNILPACLDRSMISQDFAFTAVWPRILQMLCRRDLHVYLISLVIRYGEFLNIPHDQVCLLLEPAVVASTLTARRGKYPGATSNNVVAFTEGVLCHGERFGYASPFNDLPLEKGCRNRDQYIPNFDKQLSDLEENSMIVVQKALLERILYFCAPGSGARSHYTYLNFLHSCINSRNATIASLVMRYLSEAAYLLGDSTCWMTDNKKESIDPSRGKLPPNAPSPIDPNVFPEEYRNPIPKSIVPFIIAVLSSNDNQIVLSNCLLCLGKICPYTTETDLGQTILPAIHKALPNITKGMKATVSFASFAKSIYKRCSARAVSNLFMPTLLQALFHPELSNGNELEQVRQVCDECFKFINNDAYNRATRMGGNPSAAAVQLANAVSTSSAPVPAPVVQAPPEAPEPMADAASVAQEAYNPQQGATSVEQYNPFGGQQQQAQQGYDASGAAGGYGYDSGAAGGYDQQQGYNGYGQQQSGYDNGGYGGYDQQQGGYDQQQGGYDQQQGGYDQQQGGSSGYPW